MGFSLSNTHKRAMTPTTERRRMIDQHAYELFAGQISPSEFIAPYSEFNDPIDEAIKHSVTQWADTFNQPAPSWLKSALRRHIIANI